MAHWLPGAPRSSLELSGAPRSSSPELRTSPWHSPGFPGLPLASLDSPGPEKNGKNRKHQKRMKNRKIVKSQNPKTGSFIPFRTVNDELCGIAAEEKLYFHGETQQTKCIEQRRGGRATHHNLSWITTSPTARAALAPRAARRLAVRRRHARYGPRAAQIAG